MSRIPILKMALIGVLPSGLKVLYYRATGAKIGKRVKIGPLSILSAEKIEIGDDVRIGAISFINAKNVKIGNRAVVGTMVAVDTGDFSMGHDSHVMEQVVIGGMKTPRSKISIGNRVKIFSFSFLNPTEEILIEDDVGIGGANYIFTHGTWQNVLEGYPYSFGSVKIRKGTWLPWRVFVLPGVEIGEYSTIGAGAVINKSIPARSLAVGMPAKVISTDGAYLKKQSEQEKQDLFKEILREYTNWLNYLGHGAIAVEDSGSFRLEVKLDQQQIRIVTIFNSEVFEASSLSEFDILIQWNGLSQLGSHAERTWFNLENYTCCLGPSPLSKETRQFLSRYGLRFGVLGES